MAHEMCGELMEQAERRRMVGNNTVQVNEYLDAIDEHEEATRRLDERQLMRNLVEELRQLEGLRQQRTEAVPEAVYTSAARYACILSWVVERNHHLGEATQFAANARGDENEQIDACATLVNTVNEKVEQGLFEDKEFGGITHVNTGENEYAYVVEKTPKMESHFGSLLSAVTLTGGAAWKVLELCRDFQNMGQAQMRALA